MILGKLLRDHIGGLMQERRNFTAYTMELRFSCTNPSICDELFGSIAWFLEPSDVMVYQILPFLASIIA